MENLSQDRTPEFTTANFLELVSFPEQHQPTINKRWSEVEAILTATIPAELLAQVLSKIIYETAPPAETNASHDIQAVAHCESNGQVKIFERFFEKNYAEQQYILTHETAHALAAALFSHQSSYNELAALNQGANVSGETKYVRHAIKQREAGKLTTSDIFAEQTAERLTAFLLGGGDLTNMIEIQALYLENPADIFQGLPSEVVASKDQLAIYLASGQAVNSLIRDAAAYQDFFDRTINGEPDEDELAEWEIAQIDTEILGSSELMDSYVSRQQSPNQTITIWRFLAELFSQPSAA